MKSARSLDQPVTVLVSLLMLLAISLRLPSAAFANAQTQPPTASITSIDNKTGLVTGKITATGQQFQFKLINSAQLRIGQPIYANFTTKQISLDGQHPAGQIVTISPAPVARTPGTTPGQPALHPASPPAPCCGITAVNAATGVITAKVNATGTQFEFTLSNRAQLPLLQIGQAVYTNFATKQVSLDGQQPAGQIVSISSAPKVPSQLANTPATQASSSADGGGTATASGSASLQTVLKTATNLTTADTCASSAQTRFRTAVITLCLKTQPVARTGLVHPLRIDYVSKIPVDAVVTGAPAGAAFLFRFAMVGSDGTTEIANSGNFSAASQWNAANQYYHNMAVPFTIRVDMRGIGLFAPIAASAYTGQYVFVDDSDAARFFLDYIGTVMLTSRCINCHAAGNSPTQDDDHHLHVPAVDRSTKCTNCHGNSNGATPGSAPGAPNWRMAPFVFAGKASAQLCNQIKDPAQNNGRNLDQLVDHIMTDTFVMWAFSPGPGRTTPRGDWSSFVDAFSGWKGYGAACPQPQEASIKTEVVVRSFGCIVAGTSSVLSECSGVGGNFVASPLYASAEISAPAPDATGFTIPVNVSNSDATFNIYIPPEQTSSWAVVPLQPVSAASSVTVTAHDPSSGKSFTTMLHIAPPQILAVKFLSSQGGAISSLANLPPEGTHVTARMYFNGPSAPGGLSVDFSYGGDTAVSGPCGTNPSVACHQSVATQQIMADYPLPYSDSLDLIVSPCSGGTPCQVFFVAGSQKAVLTVNP